MNEQTRFDFVDVVPVGPAEVMHLRGWLAVSQADALLHALRDEVCWQVHRIRMFGRWVDSPRLSCWMGDADAHYRYSGADFTPHPWLAALQPVRARLQQTCAAQFNSVLLNRYRNGGDSMGWHRDDEPELGPRPVIASLSLGATRRFLLRRVDAHVQRHVYQLDHGDLLVMRGHCQRDYQHALPKMAGVTTERINLTFRQVYAPAAGRRPGR
ncbi:alpha-ketoglutarate-dependent dioxygenase AlkB [Stenotrophomonas sp.]|uniref:alpha-ketoglutarate-dependent dioxygenase AlkB family protein n=1 Tax=Stenotrophomonas sp. TaxID=69392 RepID=UPI0028A75742|nr:alpha-ketoglutarate-dependent dioxygenase AlkB [Stenotrophomonas sp.]